jgi:hypothetical protein
MPSTSDAQSLKTAFVRCGDAAFGGHVFDPSDPERRFSVEILLDGVPIHAVRADLLDRTLFEAGHGDGCYAFAFMLPAEKLRGHRMVEARLANLGTPVASAISLQSPYDVTADVSAFGPGRVRWLGGLRIEGEVEFGDGGGALSDYPIEARICGKVVAAGKPSSWSFLRDDTGQSRPVATFALRLPRDFANGQVHHVRVMAAQGQELRGSPLSVIAFDDRLHALVTEAAGRETELLRTRLLDHLMPASVPFTAYEQWRNRFPPPSCTIAKGGRIAVVTIGDAAGAPPGTHTIAASIPSAGNPAAFDPVALRDILANAAADAEIIIIAFAGTVLSEDAPARFTDAFARFPDAALAYGDFELVGADGRSWPICLPAFDYERMLEQGYGAHVFAARRTAMLEALDRGASNLYRLFNAAFDEPSATGARAVHLPYPIAKLPQAVISAQPNQLANATQAHLSARGVAATVEPLAGSLFPAVRVERHVDGNAGKVSILMLTRNQAGALRTCLDSILAAETDRIEEIILVDNDTSNPEDLAYLQAIDSSKASVLRIPGPFNQSSLTNRAVETARGKYICLLDRNLEVVTRDWLAEMLSRMADAEIGAVGALVAWPNGVICHAGMILGTQFFAGEAFTDRMVGDPGYGDLLKIAHECSAVAGACLLAQREDYLAVGGLDEVAFPTTFADVDFCLKLRGRGKRIVFTTHARLAEQQPTIRSADGRLSGDENFGRALHALRERWGDVLVSDPYYSPLLALDPIPYAGLAWPPRSRNPRISEAAAGKASRRTRTSPRPG